MGRKQLAVAAAAALGALWSANGALAQSIGINFSGGQGANGVSPMDPGDLAGVFAQTNWNNLDGAGDVTGASRSFNDSVGNALNLNVWWNSPNTWSRNTAVPGDANTKLLNGYIDSNNTGAATNDLTVAASQPYIAITGLPAEYTTRGYKVVMYIDGDGTNNRVGRYWGTTFNSNGTSLANVGGETALTPIIFNNDNANFGGTFTRATGTNAASATAGGNYVLFEGLTSSTLLLRADEVSASDTTLRAPINAIQIILNPNAATNFDWIATGGGNWSEGPKWSGGASPNSVDHVARFLNSITANSSINMDVGATLRGAVFDNNQGRTYAINGASTLTFEGPVGSIDGATVDVLNGSHSISAPVQLNSNTKFTVAAGQTLAVGVGANGGIGGAGALTKAGAGTMLLGGSGFYTGATQVDGGTLRLTTATALPGNTFLTSGATGGTLDLNGFSQTVSRLGGAVGVTSAAAATLTIAGQGDANNSGVLAGNLTILKQGTSIQGLSGANTFTGTFTIESGTVRVLSSAGVFGSTNAATIINGGILSLWANSAGAEPIVFGPNGGEINDRGTVGGSISLDTGLNFFNANSGVAEPIHATGVISGAGTIVKGGAQDLFVTAQNTFAGGVQVNLGGIKFGSSTVGAPGAVTSGPIGTGILTAEDGTRLSAGNAPQTVGNNMFFNGGVTFAGNGTNNFLLTLSGTVDMNGGQRMLTVEQNGDTAISGKLTNGGIVKAGPGTLILTNTTNDFNAGITLVGGRLSINSLSQLGSTSQFMQFQNGMLQITGNTIANLNAMTGVDWTQFSGGFDIADAAHTFTVTQSLGGGGFFQKAGPGTVVLAVDNSNTGGTIVDGGTLRMGTANSIPDNTPLTVNGGLLDLRGFNKTFSNLNGTGGAIGNTTATPMTLTIGANDGTGTFGGVIQNGSGAGVTSLVKTGAGTINLGGANTYTGPTTVSGGTLNVNGSLASTPVTVQSGGTLGGGGLIPGSVVVQSDGTIAPTGKLRAGALNLNAGSKLTFNLLEPGNSGSVTVQNAGGFTVGGGVVTVTSQLPVELLPLGTAFPIIHYNGAVGGNINNLTLSNAAVGDAVFTLTNAPGTVSVTVGTLLQTWTGNTDGTWDTATNNWTGAGLVYANAKPVRFDDTGTNQAVNIASAVTPSRIDLANATKDYTFTGASISGAGALNKSGPAKAIFNQPLLHTGATTINSGVLQLNGASTLTATASITLNNTGARPLDNTGPLAAARGGTLYFGDDTVGNRVGTKAINMNGGSLVAAKGATAGNGALTVPTVNADTAMNRVIAGANGGTYALTITNLNRAATATMDFRSDGGNLGDATNGGQIKISNLNGSPFSAANLNQGLIGAWATTNDNYASYDNALGVIPNVTNVQTDFTGAGATTNLRNTATNQNLTAPGDVTVNSIIHGSDVIMPSGSTITVQSGAMMMSGPNKWWQSTDNNNPALVQAGPGVDQMVVTVNDTGTDHRLRWRIQDNGTPLNFIKHGDGWLRLNEANTYTGQTFVNGGTLALNNASSLGGTNGPAVIVRPGATLDLQGQTVGMREVWIGGAGVSTGSGSTLATVGALINNGGGNNDAVRILHLTGDATVGGTGRFDVRTNGTAVARIDGGTFTLTKVGGNQVSVVNPESVSLGNIVINAGNLSFESKNEIMGSLAHSATINSGGTLMLWNNIGTMTQSKPLVLNGGRLLGQNNINVVAGPVRLSAANSTVQADSEMRITNIVLGPGGFTKTGTGLLTMSGASTYTGVTTVARGTLTVTGSIVNSPVVVSNQGTNGFGTMNVPVNLNIPSLEMQDQGRMSITSTGTNRTVLKTGALSFTGSATGQINVNNNGLVVDTAPGGEAAALAAVKAAVISGYNASGTNWTGNGIISTNAQGANASSRGVGYALSSDVLGPGGGNFLGTAVDGSAVLARFTLLGDATVDGAVDFNDLVKLAQNYNVVDGSRTWGTGDFTYDGNVDFNDLVKLAQNYNTALPTDAIPGAPAGFGGDLAAAFAAVPEPGALGLLGIAAAGLAGRRRRRTPAAC